MQRFNIRDIHRHPRVRGMLQRVNGQNANSPNCIRLSSNQTYVSRGFHATLTIRHSPRFAA